MIMQPDSRHCDNRSSVPIDVQIDQASTLPRRCHGEAIAPELDWSDVERGADVDDVTPCGWVS